ncbi:MAG: hypothetical protein ISN29_10785 [Gammaproteobacteria bacterium AqS3]|nr:hypothetical protein [Gammaproteobacteria bacterium AqS3]
MKNLKAFSRAGAPLPSESRIESTTLRHHHHHHHRPPPCASLSRRLLTAGALLLSALALSALSAPAYAQGFDFFDTPVRVQEGSFETFRVRLTQQPTANVTVIVTTSNNKIRIPGAYSPFTMTFTPEDWNVYQRVPVVGQPDSDSEDETANVLLSASGGGYNGVTGSVAVTVLEHDLIHIVSTGDQIMVEGRTTSSITFRLSRQPTANVTVTLGWRIGIYGNPNIAIDTDPSTPGNQHTATFTRSNWNVNRTATLTPIHDMDHSHEIGELYLRLPNGTEQHRTFIVFDDDIQAVVLPTSLTINEGGTGTFTVRMADQAGANSQAVLSLTSDNPDVTFSPNQLHFSRSNWNAPRTVTVRAAQDSDSLDDMATIRLRDLYDVQDASVSVSVIDDEAPTVGLTLSADELSLDEGHSTTFTVRLTAQPGNIRTVSLAASNKDVTITPATLRFSTSDWNIAQTVTVRAAHDDDGVNDNTAINLTGAKITSASLPVEIIDDDGGIRLELTPGHLALHEGDLTTFTVAMAAQPGSDRTVALSVSTSSGLTVSPTSLSFTRTNWESAQTVTVRAGQDADSLDGSAMIRLTGQGIISGSVSVRTIDDDDAAVGLTLSPTSLTPNEGMSETFTVRLAAQPANPRTVSLAVPSGSDVTVSPTTLNFSTSNWSTPQTVTVSTEHDDDGMNDMATVSLTGERITSASLQVEVIDDDGDIRLILTPNELTMDEGASTTFTVAMAAQPGEIRTVAVGLGSGSDLTVTPTSLSFSTSNWSTAQTVTVRAAQDADKMDDNATINLTGDGITANSVEVTVTDDEDTAVGLTLSVNELVMDEGTSKTFTVRLAAQPGNPRTVVLASTNTDVTPSPATLHFTTSNWSTAQTVTVSAAHDDDGVDDTATISLTGARLTSASVSVSVADDDAAIGLTLSDDELLLHEGDSTILTVRLANRPGRARTVNLAVEGDSNVTVAPATLRFTTTNWNTAQNVTVGAAQDADHADESSTINLSGQGIITNLVPVSVIDDDDVPVGLTLSATSLTLNEGASTTFTVRLAAQPGNPRTVNLSAPPGFGVTATPAVLSFSITNWSTAQTVTLRAAHDDNGENEDEAIRLSGVRITPNSVEVQVIDDDAAVGLNLSSDHLALDEGASATFTVQLAAQPHSARTVNLSSTNADVTVTPSSLNFTTSNWSTAQTVTVRAGQDEDALNDTAIINLTGAKILASFARVMVADDEDLAVGLDLTPTSLSLNEGGSATFIVELFSQPGNARVVNLASTNTDVTVTPATLNFSTSNWSTPQTVTVRAAQDDDGEDEIASIRLTGVKITSDEVGVVVIDDDAAVEPIMSPASLFMDEGASTTFTVELAVRPGNARVVNLASDNSDVTVTPTTLNFSTSNWNTAQTVTVNVAQDADALDDFATISATGKNIASNFLGVRITDDEDTAVGLTLSEEELTLNEGASTTFTVRLAAQPRNPRSVTLASTNTDVTATPATLNFTTSNWSTAQTVTVRAAQDADANDETATINLTGKRITSDSVSVSVADDDTAVGLNLSEEELTLNEGTLTTFTVRLAAQPGSARSVSLASTNTDVTVTPESLNFSTSSWSIPQTVTVRARQDDDTKDETATINLTGANITAHSVEVSVTDDDDPAVGLTLSEEELTLNEGASTTFTVRLAAQPRNSRTVNLLSTNADVTVSPESLHFSVNSWSTAQTVTVRAAQDSDTEDETAAINLFGARITTAEVSVSVADDDAIGLTLSTDGLRLHEGDSTAFTVRLAAQPGSARSVNLASSNTDVTVTPTTLNFSTSNWSIAQTVTVRAAQDADAADDHATIRLSGVNIAAHLVSVSVTDDDDSAVGLTLSATSLTLNEGSSATFTVRLAAQPRNLRTVTLGSSNADVTVSPEVLHFSVNSWNTVQTVTVRVRQDSDSEDETATINLFGARITAGAVSVSVADDDAEGLTLSTDELTLDEGGTTSFTVRLTAEPAGARTVNLASSNSDVTVTPESLSFSTSNWSTAQTVTVRAAQDADAADDHATIRLSGSSIAAHLVSVSVTDDEDAAVGLTLSATSLTLNEGASTTFTVRLTAQPGNARVVNLSSTNSDVTTTPATLNFSTSNWSTAQTVRVRAAQDGDTDDETATINLAGARITAASVSVSVTDDDAVGLTLSATSLRLDEGASTSFTVRLAAQPPSARSVTLASTNTDVTVTPATLNFSTSNWSAPQTVTISAAQDTDAVDDTATINLTGANITAASASVTVTDDEDSTSVLSVTTIALEVNEGSSTTFQMALGTKPSNPRVVNLTSTNPDVTVKPTVLNFSVDNWNVPQTVTVSAAHDADDVNDTATINVTGVRVFHGSLSVTVTDDDDHTTGLTLSALSLRLDEGASKTFTVRLTAQPDSSRTVIPESTNSDVTFSPTRLTFTSSTWSTAQTLTIRAASDVDAIDDEAKLSLMGSGIVTASVNVTVKDTDEDELEFSASSLTMVEGEQAVIGVRLKTPPIGSSVTVEMSSGNSDMRFNNSSNLSLSFTTSNWHAFKYVVATALADADVADESSTISLAASGGNYDERTGSIPLTVYDDDYIELTPPALEVTEGQGGSFTVNLAAEPPEKTAVVRATILDPEAHPGLTIDTNETAPGNQSLMTFTAGDWKVPQTVKFATSRDDDAMNSQASIGFALTTDADSLRRTVLRVKLDDNDTGPGLRFSMNSLELRERGSQSQFSVKLRVQPSATVNITVTSSDTSVSVDTDTTKAGNQNTLTFTSSNWNTYQHVNARAAGDSDYSDNTATLTVAASGGGYGGVSRDLPVTVLDEDSLVITAGALFLTEGTGGSFSVRLDRQPSENITLTLLPSPAGSAGPLAITFDTNSASAGNQNRMTFTSSNWNVNQTVSVSAIDDTALGGDKSYPLVFFLGDIGEPVNGITQAIWERLAGKYRRVGLKNVAVYDDEIGREVSTTSLVVREGGNETFTVRLTSNILLERSFPMQSDNPDVTLSPSSLTFTSANWSTAQTVTVSAAHDDDVLDDSATISMGGTVIPAAQVSVLVTDDEDSDVGLTFSVSELELNEGALATFTVRLSAQPDSSRTLTLASSNPDVTFSPATLNFSRSEWNTAQTVTVRGEEDADAMDDNALLSFTGTGIVTGSIEVSVADRDDPTVGLTLSETSLELNEGASATFTVQLAAQPRNDRTVTLVPTDPDVTVAPKTLTFFANNWSVVQTVTVSAAQDEDSADETVTISLTGERVTPGSVSVEVSDNDLAGSVGLTLSVSALSVGEGSSATFTVQLAAAVTDGRTVNLASDNPDVTVDTDAGTAGNQTSLSFTPANWSAPQTVTVRAAQDADNIEDTATIELSGQRIYEKSLKVTVSDDDAAIQLRLSEDALTLNEGASANFTVQLATQPLSDRTVTLTSDNPDVTLSSAELNFSPSNWNIAQTVRVTAAQDDDSTDDTANVNLSGEKIVPDTVEVTVNDDDGGAGLNLSAIAPEKAGDGAGRFAVQLAVPLPDGAGATPDTRLADGSVSAAGGFGPARTVAALRVDIGEKFDRRLDRPLDRPQHSAPPRRLVQDGGIAPGSDHRCRLEPARLVDIPESLGEPPPRRHS